MFDLDIFYLHQLVAVAEFLQRVAVPPAVEASQRLQSQLCKLYPYNESRCFCRARKSCSCKTSAAAAIDSDGRCVVCHVHRTCKCLKAPLIKAQQAMVEAPPDTLIPFAYTPPSWVPYELGIDAEAILKMRVVNHEANMTFKRLTQTHFHLHMLFSQYKSAIDSMANIIAHQMVVGTGVGCKVGICSRCEGNIHQCNCRMFTCSCNVCIWVRKVASDPTFDVTKIFDNRRGSKPERATNRVLPTSVGRDKGNDAFMLRLYLRKRRKSYEQYVRRTPEWIAAQNRDRLSLDLKIYDESLDSDVESREDGHLGSGVVDEVPSWLCTPWW